MRKIFSLKLSYIEVFIVCQATEQQLKNGFPRSLLREHANVIQLPLDEEESDLLRSLVAAAKQFHHFLILIHHALDGPEAMNLAAFAHSLQGIFIQSLHLSLWCLQFS